MIEFKNVSKSFGKKRILNDFSFKVFDGETLFILGQSGTGKSVTLKLLSGLLVSDSGDIFVDGENVTHYSEKKWFEVRRKCAMVFQQPALFDSMTVFENIVYGIDFDLKEKEKLAIHLLKILNLPNRILSQKPYEISYGMQKRVSLARSLSFSPKWMLFDEPTTGLDPISTTSFGELLNQLKIELGLTSIVVSHDMKLALERADRICFLSEGNALFFGTPKEILDCKNELVESFLSASGFEK